MQIVGPSNVRESQATVPSDSNRCTRPLYISSACAALRTRTSLASTFEYTPSADVSVLYKKRATAGRGSPSCPACARQGGSHLVRVLTGWLDSSSNLVRPN